MSFVDRNLDVLLLDINANNPSLEVLIVVNLTQSEEVKTKITWHKDPPNFNDKPQNVILNNKYGALLAVNDLEISRFYAREINTELYGSTCPRKRTEVDHWVSLSISKSMTEKENLDYVDCVLLIQTWLVGKKITLADIYVYSSLWKINIAQFQENYVNLARWFKLMQSLPAVQDALCLIKKHQVTVPNLQRLHHQGKFMDLPGAQWDKLVVRFPPEASGYLHIGHAKAALLNQYYAEMYNGQLIMRFDDTNPAKETVEFEEAILQDLKLLKIKPKRFTHTSDYFDRLEKCCTILIESGKAFVDDTPSELMKAQRDEKMKSENRDNSVEINLRLWEEMRRGTEIGQRCCVRAKIDYESKNGCLRDPTIYRCKSEAHPRTGDKYKVYPTYDFACPLVDFIENVTHPLRTTEYEDRDDQYNWILQQFGHKMPFIVSYSRLNMTHTVLSKRKLTWFVDEGLVDGWDDPRMPTIRGILRHGMTVEALKDFIIAQGSSRSVVVMEWDKIWAFNKKVIDPVAVRYTALQFHTMVNVKVIDAKKGSLTVQNHPKDPTKGTKQVLVGPQLLIEREDAECLVVGQNATFINWGNLMILKVNRDHNNITSVDARLNLEDKNYKDTLKITWLVKLEPHEIEKPNPILCYAVYFDHLLNVPTLPKDSDFKLFTNTSTRKEDLMLGEMELKRVKKGEIIQLQRKGFFICDVPYAPASSYSSREQSLILFHIPDGHATTVQKTQKLQEQVVDRKKKNNKVKKLKKEEPEILDLTNSSVAILSQNIQEQFILVQNLQIHLELETKILSDMKMQYESSTGQKWNPTTISATKMKNEEALDSEKIAEEVKKQVDKMRNLKSSKIDILQIDSIIDREMKILFRLTNNYKKALDQNWKPHQTTAASTVGDKKMEIEEKTPKSIGTTVNMKMGSMEETLQVKKIAAEIQKQGDKVRSLKNSKVNKSIIDQEVKILLSLKSDYKNATDQDWKPGQTTVASKVNDIETESKEETLQVEKIAAEIQKQGDKVRSLKNSKVDKSIIDQEVKILLSLKSDYKNATGQDWKPGQTTVASKVSDTKTESKEEFLKVKTIAEEIQKQGDKVRNLKSSKVDKSIIDQEVKILLSLKSDYKNATGQDWKPGQTIVASKVSDTEMESKEEFSKVKKIAEEIQKQGDKVRNLKSSKVDKSIIDQEVKILLSLKSDYKNATGQDWKPSQTTVTVSDIKTMNKEDTSKSAGTTVSSSVYDLTESKKDAKEEKLFYQVQEYDQFLRNVLKEKSSTEVIEKATENLAIFEQVYKNVTGEDYKEVRTKRIQKANKELEEQFSKMQSLRQLHADKKVVQKNRDIFYSMQRKYTDLTGNDWQPSANYIDMDELTEKIQEQSDKIKNLECSKTNLTAKQEKSILSNLKEDYYDITWREWKPSNTTVDKTVNKAVVNITKSDGSKKSRLGLEVKKEENFFEWYSQVITKTGMIEYYDVSGCYILRPWSFEIWKVIKDFIEKYLSKMNVQECYFPIFVTRDALEKEKTHIADFAPEVAWVTKCGNSDLAEPVAIRPTSETIMYPAYAKWLRSDTELPLKLNQWNNAVRWEFKDPKPFLRTREFLWQEGHTAFATKGEAETEVSVILDMYASVYETLLAVPIIKGRKTEKEKFAGGEYTTTVEAFIPTSGRAIQGATSHHLGQNFSKMFNIQVEGITGGNEKTFVYQNSWGLTTRTIGVMIMLHGDDKGLVLPPNVAPIQAIVIPCGMTAKTAQKQKDKIHNECFKLIERFNTDGRYKVKGDFRNNRTVGWKYCHWELKGVPVRLELGPKEIANNEVMLIRRDTSETRTCKSECVITELATLLTNIQEDMLQRAKIKLNEHIKLVKNWDDFIAAFNKNNLLLAPFCGESECEDNIKTDSASTNTGDEPGTLSMGAKSLCIPFKQPELTTPLDELTCVHTLCGKKPKFFTLFGRSY